MPSEKDKFLRQKIMTGERTSDLALTSSGYEVIFCKRINFFILKLFE